MPAVMSSRRGMALMIGIALAGCEGASSSGDDATTVATGTTGDTATGSSGATSSDGTGGTGATTGGAGCPGGAADLKFNLVLPDLDPPPSEEAGSDDRTAACSVGDVGLAGQEYTITMTCDEVRSGLDAQAYVLSLTLPPDETLDLQVGDALSLTWERWWGFEVGGGRHLELQRDGDVVLLVYADAVGGGTVENCAAAADPPRAQAQSWITRVGGMLLPASCDDLGTFTVSFDPMPELFPGQVGTTPDGRRALVADASCFMPGGNGEYWSILFAAWRP